jgi:hypothetical protein
MVVVSVLSVERVDMLALLLLPVTGAGLVPSYLLCFYYNSTGGEHGGKRLADVVSSACTAWVQPRRARPDATLLSTDITFAYACDGTRTHVKYSGWRSNISRSLPVGGKHHISYAQQVKLNQEYLLRLFWLDMCILGKTAIVVLCGKWPLLGIRERGKKCGYW